MLPKDTTFTPNELATVPETFTRKEAISEGRIFKGTVLKFGLDHVLVDIGKSKGMLPLPEVLGPEGKPRFQPGDVIEVMRVPITTQGVRLVDQAAHGRFCDASAVAAGRESRVAWIVGTF